MVINMSKQRNPYDLCPVFENDNFCLRFVETKDAEDLLKCYRDKAALALMNDDNCNFGYENVTLEQMSHSIQLWLDSYENRQFIRWSIVDKQKNITVGSVELFNRKSNDYFNNCGVLRLDLRSDYEHAAQIEEILALILPDSPEMFESSIIITKAIPAAKDRITALQNLGFSKTEELFTGGDGTQYGDYWIYSNKE